MPYASFADRLQNMSGNAIREILKLTQNPEMISFAGGLPANDCLPLAELDEIITEIASRRDPQIFQYGLTEGYTPLRELIAEEMSSKGLAVRAEDVLITSGSQQGIDLTAKAFLNKGDKVILETPTYLAAIQICRTYEAAFRPVLSDEEGILPQALQEALAEENGAAKIAYLVPTFQNPAGTTMGVRRRQQIMDILGKESITVIEDNPYGELNYTDTDFPFLKSYDREGQVVYLGSFSKIISPGLRVGFAIAEPDVLSKLVLGKQAADVHVSNLSQAVIYEFCRQGLLPGHLADIREKYREKRDLMMDCLSRYMPAEVGYAEPQGGLFIWAKLPEGLSAMDLFKESVARGVAFVPGESFFAAGGGENTMRLNFSNSAPEEVERGVKILGETIEKMLVR